MNPLPRLYAIADTATIARLGLPLIPSIEAMLEGGIRLLQLRHKEHFSREMFDAARTIAALCRQAGAQFLINDRADIAALCQAGVHLGQDDLPPGDARRILGPQGLLGFSTHNEAQLRAAAGEPVSYLAIGPVFATKTKQNPDPVLGLELLRKLRRLTALPLVAIGGINIETALAVLAAGIDSIAVAGDLMPGNGNLAGLRARISQWTSIVNGML